MITPNEVVGMSEVEKGQSQAFENAIDAGIKALVEADPMQKMFELTAASLGEVTAKVREHTFARYRKAKWIVAISDDGSKFLFSAPISKRGGRPKGSKNKPKVTATVIEVVPTAPVAEATLPAVEVVA